jgi:hypothetical protein
MGIHLHTLKFLKFAAKRKPLGRVGTMGRQGMFLPKKKIEEIMKIDGVVDQGPYCESFLKAAFGATTVESFDKSAYEGATHIMDLNRPIATIGTSYDTILDGGCLEHVYNVPQALLSVSKLCAEDGQILHVLPANNLCGHGFWQFSPELFFALYSEQNGYAETEVFLADVTNEYDWYEVRKPQNGQSVVVVSSTSVLVLARTIRAGPFLHENVQQSFYVNAWSGKRSVGPVRPWRQRMVRRMAQAAKRTFLLPAARLVERKWQQVFRPEISLSTANPNLKKHPIDALL